jgi:ABC-type transport system involved in multi-copper enzyme maturation permease subunit
MMHRIAAVIDMTIRRLMKSRLLWVGVVGSLLVIGMFMTSVVGMVRMVAQGQSVSSIMLMQTIGTVITILGALAQLVAIFVGVSVVKRDLVDGTVASVLSKPVTRGEYIAASYVGAAAYLLLMWILFALVLTLFAAALKSSLAGAAYAAMLGRWLVCVMTMGIALAFSIRLHPWVAVLCTFLLLRGRSTIDGIANLFGVFGLDVPEAVVNTLQFPFPIHGALDNLGDRLSQGSLIEQSTTAGFLHVIDYGIAMALLAWFLFSRIEVNNARE